MLLAGLLISCSVPSDGTLQLAALEAETLDAAMRACSQVADPGHKGFCVADAVRIQGQDEAKLASAACSTIESPAWQSECHFFAADHLAADGNSRPPSCAVTTRHSFKRTA